MSGQHMGFDLIGGVHGNTNHNQKGRTTEIKGHIQMINQDIG